MVDLVKTKITIKHGDLVKTQLLMMNHPFCWFNLHIYRLCPWFTSLQPPLKACCLPGAQPVPLSPNDVKPGGFAAGYDVSKAIGSIPKITMARIQTIKALMVYSCFANINGIRYDEINNIHIDI